MNIENFKGFKDKIWLSSPTMHGEELDFIHEAFKTNWIAPFGKNVDEYEKNWRNLWGGLTLLQWYPALLRCIVA